MVGRLTPQKNPLTLLEVCRLLDTDFRLLMVGDGELRTKLEEFVVRNNLGEKVIFTGERNDISDILAASDIFVLSSRWEGLPAGDYRSRYGRIACGGYGGRRGAGTD